MRKKILQDPTHLEERKFGKANSVKHKSEWAEVGILLCIVEDYS